VQFLHRSELEDLVHRRADQYWAALRHKNILIKRREENNELTMRAKLLERGNVNVRGVRHVCPICCAGVSRRPVVCLVCAPQELVTVLRNWPTPDHCPGAFKDLISDLITNMFREKKAGTVPVLSSQCWGSTVQAASVSCRRGRTVSSR
jgi:hypothetical protein